MSDVEIAVCNFTIAFWVRLKERFSWNVHRSSGPQRTLIWGSTSSGKLLALFVRNKRMRDWNGNLGVFLVFYLEREVSRNRISKFSTPVLLSTSLTIGTGETVIVPDSWVHIAVTCQQYNKVKMHINGYNERESPYYFKNKTISNIYYPAKKTYTIGRRLQFANTLHMIGSIMDLHIIGFALPPDDISDLYKGQQTVKMNSFFLFTRWWESIHTDKNIYFVLAREKEERRKKETRQ